MSAVEGKPQQTGVEHTVREDHRGGGLSSFAARYALVAITIAIIALFSVLAPNTFPTWLNAKTILGDNSVSAILALGVLVPLVVGEFDLSVGALLGLAAVIAASLTGGGGVGLTGHLSVPLAVALTIAFTTAIGVLNGLMIVRAGISSFIATLATGTVASGIQLYITGGESLFMGVPSSLFSLGGGTLGGIPRVTIYAIVVLLVAWFVLEHSPVGRRLYAIGGSAEAAAFAGVRVDRGKVAAFAVSGAMAGVAGVLELGRIGAAHPDLGSEFLLPALAAGYLGATAIRPGRFNPWGTAVAVIFLAVGVAGLQQIGAPQWVEPVFNGTALAVAVGLSAFQLRRAGR